MTCSRRGLVRRFRLDLHERRVEDDPGAAGEATAFLEEAGAQIGRLQVTCCTPKRLPLYTRILTGLTTIHLTLDQARGAAH